MSKEFNVGTQYKLVQASKDRATLQVINSGELGLPDDNTFTCHAIDRDGDCYSTTDGVTWKGHPAIDSATEGWLCASLEALNAGAFEEVADE